MNRIIQIFKITKMLLIRQTALSNLHGWEFCFCNEGNFNFKRLIYFNLMSLIREIFVFTVFDFNFYLFQASLFKCFHIRIVWKTDHVIIIVFVNKVIFTRQPFEHRLNKAIKLLKFDNLFGSHYMDLVFVNNFEEHVES